MSQQPTCLGPLRGLASALEYLLLLACLYALNTLIVPILFGLGCAYLLARRRWDWCRTHWPRRVLAALVLLFYTPRPVDGRLYLFCNHG